MGKRILIVDDDPWIRRMVSTMLAHEGYSIETANNGEEGLEVARSWQPNLVITDVLMDTMDGWTLVKQLRSHPRLALVPVIFLTALDSEQDRIRGFRLGADDFLPKPFHFEELKVRIERTLGAVDRMQQHARALVGHVDSKAALKGDLGQIGIGSLLTLLEMDRKSGVLLLRAQQGEGRLFLRDGRVHAATLGGTSPQNGAEAVYTMLSWKGGQFEFSAVDVDMDDQIKLSTTHLLMEGARRLDEASEAERLA